MSSLCAWTIRTRWAPPVLLAALAALAVLPLGGLGLPICLFKLVTGLPCPGCGMTRSLIHLAHGDVRGAWLLHPLGLVVFAIVAGFAALTFVPARARGGVAVWIETRSWQANAAGWLLGATFIIYGTARLAWVALGRGPSIW